MKKLLYINLITVISIYCQTPQQNEAINVGAKKNFEIEITNPPGQNLQWDEPVLQQSSIVLGIADKTFPKDKPSTTKYSFKGLVAGPASIILNQRDASKTDKPIVSTRTINITVTEK